MVKLAGFTLIETLIAGVILSLVMGIGTMTYLNVSYSLIDGEQQYLLSSMSIKLDSINGLYYQEPVEEIFQAENGMTFKFLKSQFDNEALFKCEIQMVIDSGRQVLTKKRLYYEP